MEIKMINLKIYKKNVFNFKSDKSHIEEKDELSEIT